jgi:PKD repeat protein
MVDHVAYDDADPWPTAPGGNGPTLALIDPSLDNALPESWDASEQDGGTPGAINFPPDPTPIVLTPNGGESWERGTTHEVAWVNFAGYTGNIQIELYDYSVTPPDVQMLVYNLPSAGQSWNWTILPNQATGSDYRIRISDLSGAPFDESDTTFTITEMFVAPEIVITEIMYNPPEAGNDSLEFIELFNNGDEPVDLEGYYFTEGISHTFTSVTLNPSDYYVLCIDSVAFHNTFGMAAIEWDGGALSNGGEDIILVNPEGRVVDSLVYDDNLPWDTLAYGHGPSLTLCNPGSDNALPENWSASTEFAAVNANNDTIYATPFDGCAFFLPIPYFEAEDTTIGVGFTAVFEDMSLGEITAWEWTFEGGDPATSTQQDPPPVMYDTPGLYDVTLTVTNANGDSTLYKADYISVDYAPEADFEADATQILAGYSTNFSDLSTGNPTSWEWSFEGGTPASFNQQAPPEIFYNDPGVFDVTLTVSNDYGESVLTREDYITVVLNSIDELATGSIQVYPNPSKGELTLKSANLEGAEVHIYSLIGKLVHRSTVQEETTTLDLDALQKGLYILCISGDNGNFYSQKIIIE